MAERQGRVCYYCWEHGHIKRKCPNRQCNNCGQYGHLHFDCTRRSRRPEPRFSRQEPQRCPDKASQGIRSFRASLALRPSAAPVLPVEEKDMDSNIRSIETVKRVTETIFTLKKDSEGPFCILPDKPLEHFQEGKNGGLLCIPKREEELQRGDLDTLRDSMSPNAQIPAEVDVADLCLCSDDLPPKDGIIDEADENVRRAIDQWWSYVTHIGSHRKMSDQTYRYVLASFCNSEDVKTFSEAVQDRGKKYQTLRLDEQQEKVIQSDGQFVFITGPPGCGKTIVLAEKALQWHRKGKTVFLVYTQGKTTNQPGAEFLWYFMENISHLDGECFEAAFPRLHKMQISSDENVNEFLDNIVTIKNDPRLGKVPKSSKRKPADDMFEEVLEDVPSLENVFSSLAMGDARSGTNHNKEKGEEISFVMDELSMRTTPGKTTELISSIKSRFPSANIWCAGPFPPHSPEGFHVQELFYAYRCTPKTQRILAALEPFCQTETSCVFKYTITGTSVPRSPIQSTRDHQYRLPDDGSDPVFTSHAGHGSGEIVDCPSCAQCLVDYLKNTLNVGEPVTASSGKSLEERDVIIVVTGTALFNRMRSLVHTEFYRKLTGETANFRLNVYSISDTFDLHKAGISVLHVRAVAGVEKKVMIYVPCRQYQASHMSYADAVRSQQPPKRPMLAVAPQSETPNTHGQGHMAHSQDQTSALPSQGQSKPCQIPAVQHLACKADLQGRGPLRPVGKAQGQPLGIRRQGQPQTGPVPVREGDPIISNSERHVREKLETCPHITEGQRQKLARLGALNLHWLWYAASRSLSHVVIFHF